MANVYIDGKPYEVNPDQNLLHGCLSLGFDLPYFCWHPALGSVGACRQCAVKQFKDEQRYSRENRHVLHDARGRRHRASPSTIPKRSPSAPALSRD